MAIVVQKYGGTSVENHEKVLAVARRVAALRREGKDVVVVVSAQGGTTDDLVREATLLTPAPAQRELDMLMTAGERISMALLAIALNSIGCRAISFTGSQVGIITDTRHTDARILEVRPHRVREELEKGNVVVVGGFQGVSTAKEVTTLGRGGSDTTAVALAAALGAERCEILTDVDAVYTADPRAVPGALRVPEIRYEDMAELARYGAVVLKEDCVRFAERSGIVIKVGSSAAPGPGTIVLERPERDEPAVVGLSLLPSALLLAWKGAGLGGATRRIGAAAGTVKFLFSSGDDCFAAVVPADAPDGRTGAVPPDATASPVSLLCVAGAAAGSPKIAAGVSGVIEAAGARTLAALSTARSIVVAVEPEAGESLLRALHNALIAPGVAP
jgi:aspartate kinase